MPWPSQGDAFVVRQGCQSQCKVWCVSFSTPNTRRRLCITTHRHLHSSLQRKPRFTQRSHCRALISFISRLMCCPVLPISSEVSGIACVPTPWQQPRQHFLILTTTDLDSVAPDNREDGLSGTLVWRGPSGVAWGIVVLVTLRVEIG